MKNKILIDARELVWKPAGIGRVVLSLTDAMMKIDKDREYIFLVYQQQKCFLPHSKLYPIKPYDYFWHFRCAMKLKKDYWDMFLALRSPIIPALVPDKSIYFIHDLISFKYPQYFTIKTKIIERLFTTLSIKRSRSIVTFSRSTAEDIIKLCPRAENKIHIIHEAANEIFHQLRPDKEILEKYKINSPYILTVGTIEPRKNHLKLLAAYNALPENIRRKYKLIIVGKRGWNCKHIINKINNGVKSGSVSYLEFVPDRDLVHIYNGAYLFIYPSLYEGFGLPVIEAMNCGLPVITSNISSLPEVAGNAALLISPQSDKEISNAILKIVSDANMKNRLSSLSLTQSNKFNWETSARQILKIIDSF